MLQTTNQEKLLGVYEIKTITFVINNKEYKGFDANMSLLERTLTWSYLYNIEKDQAIIKKSVFRFK